MIIENPVFYNGKCSGKGRSYNSKLFSLEYDFRQYEVNIILINFDGRLKWSASRPAFFYNRRVTQR